MKLIWPREAKIKTVCAPGLPCLIIVLTGSDLSSFYAIAGGKSTRLTFSGDTVVGMVRISAKLAKFITNNYAKPVSRIDAAYALGEHTHKVLGIAQSPKGYLYLVGGMQEGNTDDTQLYNWLKMLKNSLTIRMKMLEVSKPPKAVQTSLFDEHQLEEFNLRDLNG